MLHHKGTGRVGFIPHGIGAQCQEPRAWMVIETET